MSLIIDIWLQLILTDKITNNYNLVCINKTIYSNQLILIYHPLKENIKTIKQKKACMNWMPINCIFTRSSPNSDSKFATFTVNYQIVDVVSTMASSGGGATSNPNSAPKILLAKPGLVAAGKFARGGGGGGADEDAAALRSRLPSVGSLNLLSDSWDFQIDRFLPVSTPAC